VRLLVAGTAAVALTLALPAIASKTVLLGQVAFPDAGGCTTCAAFQLKTQGGQPPYKVPSGDWWVKAWSAQGGGMADGDARLIIFRRTNVKKQFRLIGRSHMETVPADDSPFFSAAIRVEGGDMIGIQTESNLGTGVGSGNDGDKAKGVTCAIGNPGQKVGQGTACPLSNLPQTLANVEAKLRPR
jgi:hypothetical protein